MAEDLQLQLKKAAKDLPSLLGDLAEEIHHPKIVAIKGHPCTGKKLAAFLLAAALRCPLIKEDDIGDPAEDVIGDCATNQVVVCRIAQSQLELGLSVVINSDLSTLGQLTELAEHTKSQLVIVECRMGQAGDYFEPSPLKNPLTQFDKLSCTGSDYEGSKFTMEVTPVIEDIKNSVSLLVRSITELDHGRPLKCEWHKFEYWDVLENNQSQFSDPTFKCKNCDFVFHKSCTELPPKMEHPAGTDFILFLKHTGDELWREPICRSCMKTIEGYFYWGIRDPKHSRGYLVLHVTCLFLPFKRRVKLHEHELQLSLGFDERTSKCKACRAGIYTIGYSCDECWIELHPNCAWLPDTAVYKGHRHPFQLSVAPTDESNEYYCDVCEEKRDPSHWIYYCAECDYPAHTSCLVPVAWPPPDPDNK